MISSEHNSVTGNVIPSLLTDTQKEKKKKSRKMVRLISHNFRYMRYEKQISGLNKLDSLCTQQRGDFQGMIYHLAKVVWTAHTNAQFSESDVGIQVICIIKTKSPELQPNNEAIFPIQSSMHSSIYLPQVVLVTTSQRISYSVTLAAEKLTRCGC